MAKSSRSDVRTQAKTVRARLDDEAFPMKPEFKPHAKGFITTQTTYESAAAKADAAEQRKADALEAVGELDTVLDDGVDQYADTISANGLGTRQNPFKGFSKHSPGDMKVLAYANEVKAVRELVTAVEKKKPAAAVLKAGKLCLTRAAAVEKALAEYGKPATAYTVALAARDALAPDLQKALKALKTHAASAYAGDPATLKALFAPAEAVQAPKAKRKATKTAKKNAGEAVTNGKAEAEAKAKAKAEAEAKAKADKAAKKPAKPARPVKPAPEPEPEPEEEADEEEPADA